MESNLNKVLGLIALTIIFGVLGVNVHPGFAFGAWISFTAIWFQGVDKGGSYMRESQTSPTGYDTRSRR